jgi:hypothetical protein
MKEQGNLKRNGEEKIPKHPPNSKAQDVEPRKSGDVGKMM